MEEHRLDFHGVFRALSGFRPSLLDSGSVLASSSLEDFVKGLLGLTPEPELLDHGLATSSWLEWLETYAKRIDSEKDEWVGVDVDVEREKAAKAANPRFVLRQWVLEEVISKVEKDSGSGKMILAKVLQVRFWPKIFFSLTESRCFI